MCKHNPINLNKDNYRLDKRLDIPDTVSWPGNGIGRKVIETDEVLFNDRDMHQYISCITWFSY